LCEKSIEPRIPPKKNHKIKSAYDEALYKQRRKVENMLYEIPRRKLLGMTN